MHLRFGFVLSAFDFFTQSIPTARVAEPVFHDIGSLVTMKLYLARVPMKRFDGHIRDGGGCQHHTGADRGNRNIHHRCTRSEGTGGS